MATKHSSSEEKDRGVPKTPVSNYEDVEVEPGYKSAQKNKAWPRLTEEEQDLAYELRAQLMRNIEEQNQRIKTELALHEKMKDLKLKKEQQKSMKKESELIRVNAIKCMKLFEKKFREAQDKNKDLQLEAKKAKRISEEYKELYEAEVLNHGGNPVVPISARGDGDTVKMMRASTSPLRISDIIRKNECLLIENNDLKRDIRKLKLDNIELIKKVKGAETHALNVTNQLATSESARIELIKRFRTERDKHNNLSRSMSRQATDWLQSKKRLQELEEETRWHGTSTMDVLGAEKRLYQVPVTKNVFTPKKMLPVEQWATVNQS